jgi:hypothetical protein
MFQSFQIPELPPNARAALIGLGVLLSLWVVYAVGFRSPKVDKLPDAEMIPSVTVVPDDTEAVTITELPQKTVEVLKRTFKKPLAWYKSKRYKKTPNKTYAAKKKYQSYSNMQYSRLDRIRKQNRIRDNDYRTVFPEGVNADYGRY